ncbi:Fused isobutyryl-CoA mutase [Arenibacter antarcticus]|uniref:Methylmalonyl-CoA mutase subunit beta n=1 Tax=Arenibacter antarcticus TaxID=2040469 RepID=A0ABW5VKC3_9FLAO|nr:methylmalonyl-CoA mutase subunit beta [Arenibacter sp. H213]MCM4169009.1 methylmalonyl-CoA mutase [Arenibacter sp. H213]
MSNSDLFGDFREISAKEWKQKIQVDLKGEDYNEQLIWESPEGIKIKPFYHSEDMATLNLPNYQTNNSWGIGQAIYAGNTAIANKNAVDAINRGAESIHFTVPSIDIAPKELLKNIDLKTTTIYFNLQFLSDTYCRSILELTGKNPRNIFLNIDIIGNLARSGNWFSNLNQDHKQMDMILGLNHKATLSIDLGLYENAGANRVQQLAYALAHTNEYLNHLERTNKAFLKKALITFKVAIGGNYFFEIAKLRALRMLFSTLAKEYGALPYCHIIAVPTKRNKTLYDYNNNMLRTTTECMSAILGGADTVCNLPYDAIYKKENEFGTRMARNQLLLLKEEAYLNKVGNAPDGSYYIETLTQQLASKALELFKQIEVGGGFLVQLKDHLIQKKIKESSQKEQERFNKKETILVGANKYFTTEDKMKNNLELYPFVKTNARKTLIIPIIEKRLSEEGEQKRLEQE